MWTGGRVKFSHLFVSILQRGERAIGLSYRFRWQMCFPKQSIRFLLAAVTERAECIFIRRIPFRLTFTNSILTYSHTQIQINGTKKNNRTKRTNPPRTNKWTNFSKPTWKHGTIQNSYQIIIVWLSEVYNPFNSLSSCIAVEWMSYDMATAHIWALDNCQKPKIYLTGVRMFVCGMLVSVYL